MQTLVSRLLSCVFSAFYVVNPLASDLTLIRDGRTALQDPAQTISNYLQGTQVSSSDIVCRSVAAVKI